jgi:threonine/homoserine/homoserine lactone efflux protein
MGAGAEQYETGMTAELMLAYASFAFVGSITPGPNNAMLLSSGLTYGFRRTVPHIAGISLGCAAMLVLAGFGFGAAFAAVPVLYQALRYVSAAYLLWLAWSIARSGHLLSYVRLSWTNYQHSTGSRATRNKRPIHWYHPGCATKHKSCRP